MTRIANNGIKREKNEGGRIKIFFNKKEYRFPIFYGCHPRVLRLTF
jgi:hypothetical protein